MPILVPSKKMDIMNGSIFAALWWQSAVSDKAHQITHSECHLNNISPEILVPIAPPFAIYLVLLIAGPSLQQCGPSLEQLLS